MPRSPKRPRTLLAVLALAAAPAIAARPPATTGSHDASWNDFGGPSDDFQSTSAVAAWGESGPERLWSRPLGAGYSAISVAGGRLFTLYRDEVNDVATALDAETGATVWEHRYAAPTREGNLVEFGSGPHATPLVLDDRIVTLGYTGVLHALDRDTGRVLWRHDLMEDFGGELLPWGYSASPILHRGLVVVLVGGPQGVVAFDPETGAPRWRSEPSSVTYSTPRVIEVGGREELLFFAKDALRSLDAATGETLWSHAITNGYENHASNLLWDGELLWVASQQEAAGRALRLRRRAPPEVVWTNGRIRMHHWNAVLTGGVVYASLGDSTQTLAAVDLATGRILWRDRRIGLAKLVHTPSGTLALEESGELFLVRLSPEGLEVLARGRVLDGRSWSVPTLVGSRLYVRDREEIRAFDLGRD